MVTQVGCDGKKEGRLAGNIAYSARDEKCNGVIGLDRTELNGDAFTDGSEKPAFL